MKTAVIIAAGGSGKRFGNESGKQLFAFNGKPILIRTIEKFVGQVDQIIIVIKESDQEILKRYLLQFSLSVDTIVNSGMERYDSVMNGLKALRADISHVMIHDGVRPNVSPALLNRLKDGLKKYPAVIPVIPVQDTIKVIRNNLVVSTPKRAELFMVQTPQCFRKEILMRAYSEVDCSDCTDDAMVLEKSGQPVYTVDGDKTNIKITTPEDLKFIE